MARSSFKSYCRLRWQIWRRRLRRGEGNYFIFCWARADRLSEWSTAHAQFSQRTVKSTSIWISLIIKIDLYLAVVSFLCNKHILHSLVENWFPWSLSIIGLQNGILTHTYTKCTTPHHVPSPLNTWKWWLIPGWQWILSFPPSPPLSGSLDP